jgi:hypothetical protein
MGPIKKPVVTVKVEVHPGPASPAQLAAWRRFWAKMVASANHDLVKNQTSNVMKEGNCEKPN